MTIDQIEYLKNILKDNNLPDKFIEIFTFIEGALLSELNKKTTNVLSSFVEELVKKHINKYLSEFKECTENIQKVINGLIKSLPSQEEIEELLEIASKAREQLEDIETKSEKIREKAVKKLEFIYKTIGKEPEPEF